ncbi:MAG: glycoside hydrolase family 3 N-terminal domain-containing protein [Clostridia bacterium]|nr:glycoside hydrolase family 3 C-terminal domain-containing protein [Oscillospiraceae bacterium]MDY3303199.1 glycoside hydrolase family 3 N-terminal domain-containing protein [Clostridia bacterium]
MNKQQFIKDLMDKMTVREKVGQLNQCGNSIYNDDYKVGWDLLREGRIGSFLGIADVERANEMQKVAVEETRLGIPLLLGYDVIHGFRTTFPVPWTESFSWDPDLARKTAEASTMEAAANGVNWVYAPMIDITRDPRWGRGVEGAGEDTYLTSQFAEARVKGIQGDDLSDGKHLAACAKHFVGYGACMGGRDYNTADMSEQTLFDVYLPPFKSAVDAGVRTVMSAFHDLNGEPCTGSKYLLTDILRGKLGFNGAVISDAGSCDQIKIHGFTESDRDTAKTAINAGLDVEMCFGIFTFQDNLEQLVADGEVSEEMLDNAVRRVLELKYDLGLFQNPYKDIEKAEEIVNLPETRALALEAAKKSVVLLKNDGILPLKKNVKVALAGPFADNRREMLGCWAGLGKAEDAITPAEALGMHIVSSSEDCADFDVIIAFIGEPESMNGEGKSRTNNVIPEEHMELVRELKKSGKKLVSVIIGGRPLVLTEVCELSDAVLFSGALGCEAGNAYKAILTGEYNPCGKLVNTFPSVVGQAPLFYNENNTGKPPVEEFFWTSKYIDAPIKPLFPFGYGLSYTNFEYSDLSVSDINPKIGDKITVSVRVKNTGNYDGEEVVQIYVRDVVASVTRPKKELKGYKKIMIPAGETKTVEIELDTNTLGFYNRSLEYVVEKGDFRIMAGTSSEKYIETKITLK